MTAKYTTGKNWYRFRIVREGGSGAYEGATRGFGVRFPSGDVYVEWNLDAYPEHQRFDGGHVSIYRNMNDVYENVNGDVEVIG